jgi:hypothetical protein
MRILRSDTLHRRAAAGMHARQCDAYRFANGAAPDGPLAPNSNVWCADFSSVNAVVAIVHRQSRM